MEYALPRPPVDTQYGQNSFLSKHQGQRALEYLRVLIDSVPVCATQPVWACTLAATQRVLQAFKRVMCSAVADTSFEVLQDAEAVYRKLWSLEGKIPVFPTDYRPSTLLGCVEIVDSLSVRGSSTPSARVRR